MGYGGFVKVVWRAGVGSTARFNSADIMAQGVQFACSMNFAQGKKESPMPSTAVVSEKGQVTLPKVLRDRLGIVPGSRLEFRVAPGGTLHVHLLATGAGSLFGLLARPGESARTLDEMDAAVTRAVKVRAKRTA